MVYYYDATALGSNYAVNDQAFLFIGCEKFPQHDTYPLSLGGVM